MLVANLAFRFTPSCQMSPTQKCQHYSAQYCKKLNCTYSTKSTPQIFCGQHVVPLTVSALGGRPLHNWAFKFTSKSLALIALALFSDKIAKVNMNVGFAQEIN